jgi:hypothetical protein
MPGINQRFSSYTYDVRSNPDGNVKSRASCAARRGGSGYSATLQRQFIATVASLIKAAKLGEQMARLLGAHQCRRQAHQSTARPSVRLRQVGGRVDRGVGVAMNERNRLGHAARRALSALGAATYTEYRGMRSWS